MTRATFTGRAHPIGYVELQRSWIKPGNGGRYDPPGAPQSPSGGDRIPELLAEMEAEVRATDPKLVRINARLENVPDGAGVVHFTLYAGFAPAVAAAEPLDPHNLNDAPRPVAGWPEPEDGILPLGSRETKF